MTAINKPVELPDDMWREIASKHPATCLALTRVSKSLHKATYEQAQLVDAIARGRYPERVENLLRSKAFGERDVEQAKQKHEDSKRIFTLGLLPIASEIKNSRRRASEGYKVDLGSYIVIGTLHLAVSPLLVPLRIQSRVTRFNESGHALKQTIENVRSAQANLSQDRMALCNAIAKDPRWFAR